MNYFTQDLRIVKQKPLSSPAIIQEEFPIPDKSINLIVDTRRQISQIIHQCDDRLVVIVGPCSIHDIDIAQAYAEKLQKQLIKHHADLCIIMRVYFEKPRTTVGWKGLINDPDLNNEFNINKGLKLARQLLIHLSLLGVPAATEFLDTFIPQYVSDVISWGAIGARTTESQIHRELVSGLSMPIGFKNGTTGNTQIAVDAIISASHPHHFLGVTKDGLAAITKTSGNQDCHIILRGSNQGPNFSADNISRVIQQLQDKQLNQGLMVDCSHGNSNKDHRKQKAVVADLCKQIATGNQHIVGVMIESNLIEGRQTLTDKQTLTYGQSITDACIGFEETEQLLVQLAQAVRARRQILKEEKA